MNKALRQRYLWLARELDAMGKHEAARDARKCAEYLRRKDARRD